MSTLAFAILGLIVLIGPGLVVLALDALDVFTWGTENYMLSTRELPNIAAEPDTHSGTGIGTTDTSGTDTGRARR